MDNGAINLATIYVSVSAASDVTGNPTITCGNQSKNGLSVSFSVSNDGSYAISAEEVLGASGKISASDTAVVKDDKDVTIGPLWLK